MVYAKWGNVWDHGFVQTEVVHSEEHHMNIKPIELIGKE